MSKKAFGFFSVSALIVALAVPSFAQSIRLTANVPFEFTVGGRTLPAGDYSIRTGVNPTIVQVQGTGAHTGVLSLSWRVDVQDKNPAAATKLVFNRYGDKYFLSEVSDGYESVAMKLPVSHTERELANTASIQAPELVAVLAWR
jgi:hypothetical protein